MPKACNPWMLHVGQKCSQWRPAEQISAAVPKIVWLTHCKKRYVPRVPCYMTQALWYCCMVGTPQPRSQGWEV